MIEFLRRELLDHNDRIEVNVQVTGSNQLREEVLIGVSEVGAVFDRNGRWICVPWHQIVQISKAIVEPDFPPS